MKPLWIISLVVLLQFFIYEAPAQNSVNPIISSTGSSRFLHTDSFWIKQDSSSPTNQPTAVSITFQTAFYTVPRVAMALQHYKGSRWFI